MSEGKKEIEGVLVKFPLKNLHQRKKWLEFYKKYPLPITEFYLIEKVKNGKIKKR